VGSLVFQSRDNEVAMKIDTPDDRFHSFLALSRWLSALVTLMYHARFILFVNYDELLAKTVFVKGFYFITGLGHEAFAVFFVADGIMAGLLLRQRHQQRMSAQVFLARFIGVYRVLLPGLIVGAAIDLLGAEFSNGTGLYSSYPDFTTVTLTLGSFFGNILMLEPFVVPTFGSNAMLYLFSCLWWSFVLLAAFSGAGRLRKPHANFARAAVFLAAILVIPIEFLAWIAIWFVGFGVAAFSEIRYPRPPLFVGWGVFVTLTIASRIIRSDLLFLPQPFGSLLVSLKYVFVGMGFAALAWAMSPARAGAETQGARSGSRPQRRLSNDAVVICFFHFPFLMLVAGTGADLLQQKLMQQPSGYLYLGFAATVFACVSLTTAFARAITPPQQSVHDGPDQS
jgi:hypothetical protein